MLNHIVPSINSSVNSQNWLLDKFRQGNWFSGSLGAKETISRALVFNGHKINSNIILTKWNFKVLKAPDFSFYPKQHQNNGNYN